MNRPFVRLAVATAFVVLVSCSGTLTAALFWQEYKSGIYWLEPTIVDPGSPDQPPSDAIILFDGKSLDAWDGGEKWIIEDGAATTAGGSINTKQKFGDCQLHVEFATPSEVKGNGQGRGNSGIYLMGRYEVQVLDSYENTTYYDGQCGAIYKQTPPIVNACRKPGEWQTYDILFTAPRFHDDGSLRSPGYVTVLQNGIVVQNHFELQGGTSYVAPPVYQRHGEKDSISLQFHGNKTRFRNIWIRENVHSPKGEQLGGRPDKPATPEEK